MDYLFDADKRKELILLFGEEIINRLFITFLLFQNERILLEMLLERNEN
jgi:hypothetical protein